ncbi:MAG: glycosyltransferase family 4 protein [Myxococcota bacterium]
MLRRALHIHTLPLVSGSGLNTLASMVLLRGHGFEAELACGPPPAEDRRGPGPADPPASLPALARARGIATHAVPHLTRAINAPADLRAIVELAGLIRRGGYAVVHTHNSKAGFLGRIAARACRVPAIVHTVHGWAFEQTGNAFARRFYRAAEQCAAPLAHRTILVSEALGASAVRAGLPGAARRQVIYSGIDRAAFLNARRDGGLRRDLGADADSFLIGQVAKLWHGKGHGTLLAAFRRVQRENPRARLVLVGEGPLRGELSRAAHRLGLGHAVTFTGHRNDVPAVTAQLDAATLCSEYEGMGRVVIEAMAAGVPVVASRVGGISELVEEGRTGFLAPPGDARGFAERLSRLARNGELRARMGRRARARAGKIYDEETMTAEIAAVYRSALAHVRNSAPWARASVLGNTPCT